MADPSLRAATLVTERSLALNFPSPDSPGFTLRTPLLIWMFRRLSRGIAHEVANVQQMMLLPELPGDLRDEVDSRLTGLADLLAACGQDDGFDGPAEPIDVGERLRAAAVVQAMLGGEPRVRTTFESRSGGVLAASVRREALDLALLALTVVAGRAMDRSLGEPVTLAVGAADERVELVIDAPGPALPNGPEEVWLLDQARRLIGEEAGTLAAGASGGRVVMRVRLPAAKV